jgi:SHS family lactate transporter-like MFS transporter
MSTLAHLRSLNREQRAVFLASLLGWTLDAFDFFIMVFVIKAIAADFKTTIVAVTLGVTLTLMFRPLGALVFGRLADRFGRRPVLMVDIVLFSLFELGAAFAPNLAVLLVLRALFGFAMGGEWGIGSSLVMESIAPEARGAVSGILQEGYALGYLLAALVYGLLFTTIGWRGMFAIGVLPALLVLYVRAQVKESPVWQRRRAQGKSPGLLAVCRRHGKLFLQIVALMTAFNFFSHGTQDLYPTFLQVQHHFSPQRVGTILVLANVGAIIGGISFGALSQRLGRRRTIILAALLALPVIPCWAFSTTPLLLAVGAFLIQIAVQGAWGVVPAHLNELSPDEVRGTFPGFAYQVGNLVACGNATIQAGLAHRFHDNFGLALAVMAAVAALAICVLAGCGPEAKDAVFGTEDSLTNGNPSAPGLGTAESGARNKPGR